MQLDLGHPAGVWEALRVEKPTEKNLTPAGKAILSCKGTGGLVSCSWGPSSTPFPPQACSQSHADQQVLAHAMLHLTPLPGTSSPPAVPVPQKRARHSPAADFRVNVQQGASDQVAGCRAEDGRRVEDGCAGSRAIRGLPRLLPAAHWT